VKEEIHRKNAPASGSVTDEETKKSSWSSMATITPVPHS